MQSATQAYPTEPARPGYTATRCPCCGVMGEAKLPRVDVGTGKVTFGDWEAHLPKQQMTMLELLLRRAPATVSYAALIEWVWEGRDEPDDVMNTVRVHGNKLRAVLRPMGFTIKPTWGVGYRLERLS